MLSASAVATPNVVVPFRHPSDAPAITVNTPPPTAMTPAQIQQAYGFNQAVNYNPNPGQPLPGAGQTIAIVDAFNDPNIQNDLHVFDQAFGLPDPKLSVVNQSGGSPLPPTDPNWSIEISLDVEWAHAIAPGANILLVEAKSASISDLFSGVSYAANHASVVSMSWGSSEFLGENRLDSYFAGHQGVVFVASSGDSFFSSYPAASPYVLSVGGTTLMTPTNTPGATSNSEVAWDLSGGGLSVENVWGNVYKVLETEPSYQQSVQNTGVRVTPDVAYNANPATGFAVFDSVPGAGVPGWQKIGGTSAGAPQWAGLVAIVDQGRQASGLKPIDGPTQLLPALYNLSSNNFNTIKTDDSGALTFNGYNAYTGLGSPAANKLIPSLISVTTSSPLTAAKNSFASGTTVIVRPAFASDPNNPLTTNAGATNFLNGNNALLVLVLTNSTLVPQPNLFFNTVAAVAYAENARPPGVIPTVPHAPRGILRGGISEFNGVSYLRWAAWNSGAVGEAEQDLPGEPVPGVEPPPPNVPDATLPAGPESFDDAMGMGKGRRLFETGDACFADDAWLLETSEAVRGGMAANLQEEEKSVPQAVVALVVLALYNSPCGAVEDRTDQRKRWQLDPI
jgi:subtilase family serine protease